MGPGSSTTTCRTWKGANMFIRKKGQLLAALLLGTLISACDRTTGPTEPDDGATAPVTEDLLQVNADASTVPCEANSDWVSNPSLPTEIPNGGATLCDFYQFSWQSFLYMMAPSDADPSLRNFQNIADYPIVQEPKDETCTGDRDVTLFVRTSKTDANASGTLPSEIGQAGSGSPVIYDQNGNVVYYSMAVSQDMCDKAQSSEPLTGNLPENAIEMKFAWKVIDESEAGNYVNMEANVQVGDDTPQDLLLGLVGFHLAQSTPTHPEMVWASFEFNGNAPACLAPTSSPVGDYGFIDDTCLSCLENPSQDCFDSCKLNAAALNATSLTGTPTPICRVYPEGSDPNDTTADQAAKNIPIVQTMNSQIVGADGYVSTLAADNPLALLTNYRNVGALWLSDITMESTVLTNQRGSLQLANPVLETPEQATLAFDASTSMITADSSGTLNCFICHGYKKIGETSQNFDSFGGLSHIYAELIPGSSSDSE